MDPAAPDQAVELELLIDDVPVGKMSASLFRTDLIEAGIGDGRHGFEVTMPRGLSAFQDHVVRVRHAVDGRELSRSPRTLPAEPAAATEGPAALSEAIDAAAAAGPGEVEVLVGVLAEKAAALLLAQGSAMSAPATARLARFNRVALPPVAPDGRKQALVIDEGTPVAARDAGSNAILSHIRALQRLGYHVHFVSGFSVEPSGERTRALTALSIGVEY